MAVIFLSNSLCLVTEHNLFKWWVSASPCQEEKQRKQMARQTGGPKKNRQNWDKTSEIRERNKCAQANGPLMPLGSQKGGGKLHSASEFNKTKRQKQPVSFRLDCQGRNIEPGFRFLTPTHRGLTDTFRIPSIQELKRQHNSNFHVCLVFVIRCKEKIRSAKKTCLGSLLSQC